MIKYQIKEVTDLVIDEDNISLIIRASSLIDGPLLERRKEIHKSFVLAAISEYSANSEFEIKDLSYSIKTLTKCKMNDNEIISILSQLETDGDVTHIYDLKYKLSTKINIPDFGIKTNIVWKEFLEFLKKYYTNYDPFIDRDTKTTFDSILLILLTKFSMSTGVLEHQIDSLPISNFKLVIKEEVDKASLSKGLSKKYPDLFTTYMMSKSPKLLEFIFDSYSYLIDIDLIKREQEIPEVNYLDNIDFLLVDTSFLVALMCKSDNIHPLAVALANQCLKSKINLYYTQETNKEMWGLITGSKYEMKGLSPSRKQGVIRSQFVNDFRRQSLSWSAYITTLESWDNLIEDKWKIILLPASYGVSPNEDICHYVKITLPILEEVRINTRLQSDPKYKPNPRSEEQINHDACCLGLIHSYRESIKFEGRNTPIGAWFLTFDNLISGLDSAYFKKYNDFGFVIQPRTLLNYLLVYSRMLFDEKGQEAIAEAIIKFTARTPESNLDLDEYSRLVTYKMGLDTENIETIKNMFLLSPLRAELEKALQYDEGGKADTIAYDIISNELFVKQVLNKEEDRKNYKRVVVALRETKDKLREKEAVCQALEKVAKQNLSITTNVTLSIDINIINEFNSLIYFLEAEGAFKNNLLERPSNITTKENLIKWLSYAEKTIKTSDNINKGLTALLPIISHLVDKIQSCI